MANRPQCLGRKQGEVALYGEMRVTEADIPYQDVVRNAWRAGLAVPAFNVPYLPMIKPIVEAAVDEDAFVFLATARVEWHMFESRGPAAVMEEFRRWQRPEHVRLHLDHVPVVDEEGEEVDFLAIIQEGIELGYHSVMIDGSRLDLDANIETTRSVVKLAHRAGIPCEAELGMVFGHETGPQPAYEELFERRLGFTDPGEARRFVMETGCDWLSVAIGNIHGPVAKALRNRKKPRARLHLVHLARLQEAVDIPLVLHGGSGVDRALLQTAMKYGIAKVNIGTELRQAYEQALRSEGSVAAAQRAVYLHTRWIIRHRLGLSGTRRRVLHGP